MVYERPEGILVLYLESQEGQAQRAVTNAAGVCAILSARARQEFNVERTYNQNNCVRVLEQHGIEPCGNNGPTNLFWDISEVEAAPINPARGRALGQPQYPEEKRQEIIALAALPGMTARGIEESSGVPVLSIRRWLNALPTEERIALRRTNPGILAPPKGSKEEAKKLFRRKTNKLSIPQIAERLNVSTNTVEQWVYNTGARSATKKTKKKTL